MPSDNQMHGKKFENMLKGSTDLFSSKASDRERSAIARFDIDSIDDVKRGIPTSIKTTGTNTVTLSGADIFWQNLYYTPFRILACVYTQVGDMKIFNKIDEFIIEPHHKKLLLGDVSYEEIYAFHKAINVKNFPRGMHEEARTLARKLQAGLSDRLGLVSLNPKIDSKTQRRLQCSFPLKQMKNEFKLSKSDHIHHDKEFYGLSLPVSFRSTTRTFSG